MAILASLTVLSLVTAAPQSAAQEPDARLKPSLSKLELEDLNKKTKAWVAAMLHLEEKHDTRNRKRLDQAREKLFSVLAKKAKGQKTDPVLSHTGNVLAMFDGCYEYKRTPTSGEIKKQTVRSTMEGFKDLSYHFLAPKGYDANQPYRSVLVLTGWDSARSAWAEARGYLSDMWAKSESAGDSLFVVPDLRKGDDLETHPDLTSTDGLTNEGERIAGVLRPFGELQRNFHVDRRRVFLDCGPATCGFGLRLATYFPGRFAGVILRRPVDPKDLQLGGLMGTPICLVSNDKTAAVCDKLKAALDKLKAGCTVVLKEGDKANAEIEKWMRGVVRPLFPGSVIVAPNHDKFRRAYWVEIASCEPLDAVAAPEKRPMVRVDADYQKNRILVESRSVSAIRLYLNDALLDLDKEFTVVVNGIELAGNKVQRSLGTVWEAMKPRFDPTFIATARYAFEVPVPKSDKKGSGGTASGSGK
ncbi:MAG: hypothetical protein KDC87_11515 [Planctomycetes bacterium]|nr:hypothetical protein [Planctomycetota bacterium]MCB9869454.1 hypothetical protein [Planctomycetota bacterium]MCB9888487.1 hypothetical protein [Planctomycetota bacterium]